MLWKFARESAFAAGTASNTEMFPRRMSRLVAFKTRKQILKKNEFGRVEVHFRVGKVDR